MIDLRAARNDPETFRAALARKGAAETFDRLLEADAAWREVTTRRDDARARQKAIGKPSSPEEIGEAKTLKAELQELDTRLAEAEARRQELLDRVPNPPDPTAPVGDDEDAAEELRRVGEPRVFGFEPLDHLELGERKGWLDMERGARTSGARFAYRLGDGALLELALYRFALDRLGRKGFVPVLPPVLVREPAMYGTGFLPTDDVNIYYVERDELYLTGTSEVSLAALHMEEKLAEDALPLRYAGYSTCFSFVRPEDSSEEHEFLLSVEEEIVAELGFPYRVVNVAAGDLGASASKKYDIEAWMPSQQRYREITSTSNTTDFQARRLDVRFRRGEGLDFVHTLNGTAITARSLIAIMENFQDEEGTIAVPSVLEEFGAPTRVEVGAASA